VIPTAGSVFFLARIPLSLSHAASLSLSQRHLLFLEFSSC